MPQASAYPELSAALVTRLRARSNLADVNVLDQIPVNKDDIRTEAGTYEVIAMAEGDGTWDDIVFCDSGLIFDESLIITVLHEVHGVDSDDSQADIKARVGELHYETLADIATQKTWDKAALGLDVFDYVYFTPAGFRWVPGRLQAGQFAAACEQDINVRSRRSFT